LLVDWFTVAAQAVNFVVLVAILHYFLYGRIVKTVDEREDQIRSRLEEAEQKQKEVERAASEQDAREREWERERDKRLERARTESDAKRDELLEQARIEVGELRKRWHDALESDKKSFIRDLRKGIGRSAYRIARESVQRITDEALERHAVRVFRERVRAMDEEQRAKLRGAIESSDRGVTIVSAFEIGDDDRDELVTELGDALEREVEARFETAPDVICGIELVTNGHKVGFSIGSELRRLEEWAEQTLDAETGEDGNGD
jgi:F-type H+-transporting ATPase subunit b